MKRFNTVLLLCLTIVVLTSCIDASKVSDAVNAILPKVDSVIASVDQNSAAWQAQLQQLARDIQGLESKFTKDAQDTIRLASDSIDTTLQNAIGAAGAEARCNTDIVRLKVSQSLKHLKSLLENKLNPAIPIVSPAVPYVCNATPESLTMEPALRQNVVTFWGYDLANTDIKVFLSYGTNEVQMPSNLIAVVSNYKLTLNTSEQDNTLMCNKENRKVVVKWAGQTISELGVTSAACKNPVIPPPFPEKVSTSQKAVFVRVLIPPTLSLISPTPPEIVGGACSPGYVRSRYEVVELAATSIGASCQVKWVSSDPKNCQLSVSPTLPEPVSQTVCQVIVYEVGAPQPEIPACPCW